MKKIESRKSRDTVPLRYSKEPIKFEDLRAFKNVKMYLILNEI
jgi:hypothetical protein